MMSRELNALVAEKVMGWQHAQVYWHITPTRTAIAANIPNYCEMIDRAWLVVKRMIDDDSPINDKKYSLGLEYSSIIGWVADFTPRRNHPQACEYGLFRVEASTAPMAICLAALRALGIEAPVVSTRAD